MGLWGLVVGVTAGCLHAGGHGASGVLPASSPSDNAAEAHDAQPAVKESEPNTGVNSPPVMSATLPSGVAAVAPEAIPLFAFRKTEHRDAVIFARTPGDFGHHPTILVRRGERWQEAALEKSVEDGLENETWVAAVAARDGKRLWAIADTDVESPGWSLVVARSTDSLTFHATTLRKPYYMATFHQLRMDAGGHGAIVVRLDADRSVSGMADGYYTSTTRDHGATWSRWQRQANVLTDADFDSRQGVTEHPLLSVLMRELAAP